MTIEDAVEQKLALFTKEETAWLAKELVARRHKRSILPVTRIELVLTQNCNQSCDYCWIRGAHGARMKLETAIRAIELAISLSQKQELAITLFGGEPLLEFDLIKEIVAYCSRRMEEIDQKIAFNTTTNGTLMDEEKASFLSKHDITYLISIDGDRESHNLHRKLLGGSSFDRIVQAFPVMKKHQPWMGARMTICPDTIASLSDNVKCLADIGFNQFIIGRLDGAEWQENDWQIYRRELLSVARFIKQAQQQGLPLRVSSLECNDLTPNQQTRDYFTGGEMCEAASKLAITPEGRIYPCSKFIKSEEKAEHPYCVGHVDTGLTNHRALRDLRDDRMSIRASCLCCAFMKTCKSGFCPAINYDATKSIYNTGSACDYHRYVINILREELLEIAASTDQGSPFRHIRSIV